MQWIDSIACSGAVRENRFYREYPVDSINSSISRLVNLCPSLSRTGCPRWTENVLPKEVRSYDAQELTRGDDLGVLPEGGEVALVARNQIVCTGGVGAFHEHVISRI